jgi:uncharacterized protein YkwD
MRFILVGVLGACVAHSANDVRTPPAANGADHGSGSASSAVSFSSILGDPTMVSWATATASPRWGNDEPWRLPECVAYERPLSRVAAAIAAARARGGAAEMKEVVALLRVHGSPHVWPRVWMLEARALAREELVAEWSSWLATEPRLGQLRCGIARVDVDPHDSIVVAVAVDALADLAPLPRVVRVGQWLSLDALLITPARAGQLLLLGPDQSPRRVPSQLDAAAFHAAFSLDRPGFWRLQVLLDVGHGPQPALEAWLFADTEPDLSAALEAAPGELAEPAENASVAELREALWRRIDGGRRAQGLGSLRRDARLDDVAQAHAVAMVHSGRTAHDVGDGMPIDRLARAGIGARRVGENVARARSLERAHRALWDSPSHRGNLLDPEFDAVGIGVARAGVGEILVCELFADFGGAPVSRSVSSLEGRATGALSLTSNEASRSCSQIWSTAPFSPYTGRTEDERTLRRRRIVLCPNAGN